MAVFKCKICGGTIEINGNQTVATCEYCGVQQTLPRLDDEKRAQLYDRANYFRRGNEFDKAMGIYEMILSDDKEDCESYWGVVLCRYGIEYVEDPKTHKRLPTVNRAQFTSIFDDDDYKKAIQYADPLQRKVYEAEAAAIDEIQKGILAISQKEEPFDVFICYKEADALGNRTQDSVYAQDIYTALTKEGYKVFFSRITLEDKLGSAYEPYIFAALNSAKVMLVVGTSAENFNAVWVKNEWSRYLSLIKAGKEKTLIPVYKDISPYDMPEEFQYLQSQDMGKVGFMQDLLHGIGKLIDVKKTTVQETVVINTGNAQVEPLLKRAFMFLEDGDFARADEFCEQVLNIDPENAEAYLGKLMAELLVSKKEGLKDVPKPFDDNSNYQKIVRYGDEAIKAELAGYLEHINTRNENTRLEKAYSYAKHKMHGACTESTFRETATNFKAISEYKDSAVLAEECLEKAEVARKGAILEKAKGLMRGDKISNYEEAIALFETIPGWKDADEQISVCKTKIADLKAKAEAERLEHERKAEFARKEAEKRAKILKTIGISLTVVVVSIFALVTFKAVNEKIIVPNRQYKEAISLMDEKKYDDAIAIFSLLGDYSDSLTKTDECNYNKAVDFLAAENSEEAYNHFLKAGNYKDTHELLAPVAYSRGIKLLDEDKIFEAMGCFVNARGYDNAENYLMNWNAKSISIGDGYSVGLKSDGTVITTGEGVNDYGQCDVGDWTDIVSVSSSYIHTVGLKSNGTVVATGHNIDGECNVESWTDIVAISAGWDHTVGLKSDGTVVAVGDNYDGRCSVSDWTDIVAISVGDYHTVGLKSNGTVVAAGDNDSDQCNVYGWSDIVAISAGDKYTVGLKSDGTVVAVGNNTMGKCNVSDWTDIVAIFAGDNLTVGLKSDGAIVSVGFNKDECQTRVEKWTDIVAISDGIWHTVGLKSDGTVVATGDRYGGKCDVDDWTDIKQPTKY